MGGFGGVLVGWGQKRVIVRDLDGQNTKAATNTSRIADCLCIG